MLDSRAAVVDAANDVIHLRPTRVRRRREAESDAASEADRERGGSNLIAMTRFPLQSAQSDQPVRQGRLKRGASDWKSIRS